MAWNHFNLTTITPISCVIYKIFSFNSFYEVLIVSEMPLTSPLQSRQSIQSLQSKPIKIIIIIIAIIVITIFDVVTVIERTGCRSSNKPSFLCSYHVMPSRCGSFRILYIYFFFSKAFCCRYWSGPAHASFVPLQRTAATRENAIARLIYIRNASNLKSKYKYIYIYLFIYIVCVYVDKYALLSSL